MVSLEDKVRFLGSPAAYSGRADPAITVVLAVETHMSWVFLVGSEAYKLKKPAKTSFLDFSTPEARRAHCLEEVRLNLRLAPDTYLGVTALTLKTGLAPASMPASTADLAPVETRMPLPATGLTLDGSGPVVDWLVRMRRLPEGRLMDRLIARGELTAADVARLGGVLADFYSGLEPAGIAPEAYLERFRHQHSLNMAVLERSLPGSDQGLLREVAAVVEAFLDSDAGLLRRRVLAGRVVEGHGDLRPEHVCLTWPPVVIDCLEFNRFLRLVDPFEELAFLSLESARMGAAWVGEALAGSLAEALHDRPDRRLTAFHTAFRALLRAQLIMGHLQEPSPRTPELWPGLAREYLALGLQEARSLAARSAP